MEEDKITLEELKKGIEGEEKIILKTSVILDLIKHIEKLEEENKELKNKLREKICFDGHRQFEELKEENKALKNILGQYKLLTYSRFGKTFRVGDNVDDYIPKQAIRDKIEELEYVLSMNIPKQKIKEIYEDFENNKPVIAICKLKKLLEESEENK